jgi:hypothetical protein
LTAVAAADSGCSGAMVDLRAVTACEDTSHRRVLRNLIELYLWTLLSYHYQILYSVANITINGGLNERFYSQNLHKTQPGHVLILKLGNES